MVSNILAFLSELAERDIRLWLEEGQLRFSAPEGAFTAEIKERVLSRKADIISFLASAEHYAKTGIEKQSHDSRVPFFCAPLSYAQQRLWLLDQLDPGSSTYNIPAALILKGALDIEKFKHSFEMLIDRHESLRTIFVNNEDGPQQKILKNHEAIGEWWLFEKEILVTRPTQQETLISKNQLHAFNLEQGPLLKVSVFQKQSQQFLLLINMHHIISDAQSITIFITELAENYQALVNGAKKNVKNKRAELDIQYADFSIWQRKQLNEERKEKYLSFWRDNLRGAEALQLPLDKNRPAIFTERGASLQFEFPNTLTQALANIAEKNGITLFMLMLAIYQLFLSRYSSQKDISVGTPVSNRPTSELENLIGFFGNTLVLRSNIDENLSFTQFIKQIEKTTLAAFSHQDIPFEMLVDELVGERDMSNSPLFQSMFTLTQNEENKSDASKEIYFSDNISATIVKTEQTTAKYDFSLSINLSKDSSKNRLTGSFEYCVDLFLEESIVKMSGHFLALTKEISDNPNKPLHEYQFVSTKEKQQQVISWNNTKKSYPDLCLHELIEIQAQNTPNACALIFENEKISYQELAQKSSQLEQFLIQQGVSRGDGVAICLNRSTDMVITLLAVLKTGAFYIPIDPEYPQDRIDYVLNHAEPKLVISSTSLENKIPQLHKRIMLDSCYFQGKNSQGADFKNNKATINAKEKYSQNDLIYTIYTSGSTGLPKGVAVSQKAFVNFIQAMKDLVGLEQKDKVLCLTSFSFDIAGLEIWLPLVQGATLVVASKEDASDQDRLRALVEQQKISLIQATPATWQMLLATDWRMNTEHGEKIKALCGGEALPLALAQKILNRNVELYNMYGPTETTVWSALKKINKDDKKIFIGRAINNTQLYVLDEHLNVLPSGAIGELYIAGDGLAEGYLKQPELSAERFIKNPFKALDKQTSSLMYRTGDLARWTRSGELECLGRSDTQVKVRGFRIELGEIESVIKLNTHVLDAAVVVKNIKGEKQICAYVVFDESKTEKKSEEQVLQELRNKLANKLPAYMLPAHINCLAALPLTPNGKVDRKALPEPSIKRKVKISGLNDCQNERQKIIAEIWQTVLKVEDVSIEDNFFELGGQSLLATQVMSKVRKVFSLDIPLKLLFKNPTIQSFEHALNTLTTFQVVPAITLQQRPAHLPLSFSQERLWFLDKLSQSGSSAYHIPMLLKLEGYLDVDAFEQALNIIISRHESLRTRFVEQDEQVFQVIDALPRWQLKKFDASHWSEQELKQNIIQQAQEPFNLSADTLLRACVFSQAQDRAVLLVVMHHIISDARSIEILIQEVLSIYRSDEKALPALSMQYVDYALWQRSFLQGDKIESQLQFWQLNLANVPVLQLPNDKPRPLLSSNAGGSVAFSFDRKLSQQIKIFSQQQGLTVFMTLMSALQVLLGRYSSQSDFAVGTPIANREQEELQNIIGFFVNTLAIRSELKPQQSFIDLTQALKSSLLSAYENQSLPFELLVDALSRKENIERDLSHAPIFQVMLVLNQQNENKDLKFGNLKVSPYPVERNTAKFDLSLELNQKEVNEGKNKEGKEIFTGEWEYSSELFERSTIEKLATHFKNLLSNLLNQPELALYSLPLLSAEEQSVQLVEWQSARVDYDKQHCLHERFELQVQATPNALALVHGDQKYSYAELNQRANQLAHYLLEQGVQVGDVLGVCLPACPDLLISVLAILKAGGTYLPMDVLYPDERLHYFMEDSGCRWVLTHASQAARLAKQPVKTNEKTNSKNICRLLSVDAQNLFAHCPKTNLGLSLSADNLLYVIYTSGSTGLPNRTATTHAKEANLLQWYQSFGMGSSDRLLLLSAVGFDLTQKNLFAPLLSGAAIIFPEHAHYDAESLVASIEKEKVTWLNCAPSAFYPLIALTENSVTKSSEDASLLDSLRYVFLGGEPISAARIQPWYAHSTCQIVNSYGPTECTDVSHFHVLDKNHQAANIPIGLPIPNVTQYVFDEHLQLLPQGVVGELYLGGDGVGPGYLNNEVLNQSRFIENPYISGERLYKTGDLVKVRKDQSLDYLGRRDFQVKIRGVRIELGEIEQAILTEQSIKACTVIVRNAKDDGRLGDDYLCAYIVLNNDVIDSNNSEHITNIKQTLKAALKHKLPVFMQPQYFEVLNELPLTPNGKVDRKRLPIPTKIEKVFVAPSTKTEKALAQIWQEVLGVEQIGIHDNFFELGGHSLLATRVLAKVRKLLEKEIPLSKLFELDSLVALAEFIDHNENKHTQNFIQLEKLNLERPHALSYGQQRLWFLEKLNPGTSTYHMPALLKLTGTIDIKKFETSVQNLLNQQASLRTKIIEQDGEAVQHIIPATNYHLNYIDYRNKFQQQDLQKIIEDLLFKPFNFSEEFLYRIALIQVAEQESIFVMVLHHIIADGWSVDVLLQSLLSAYFSEQSAIKSLTENILEHQYIDFAHWQREYLNSQSKDISLTYWKEQLESVSALELPTDFIRPNISEQKGAKHHFSLNELLSKKTKDWAKENRFSTFMVFFAAYQVLLARMSGQKDFAIGTPIANRNHEALEKVIGFFVNTLALPVKVREDSNFFNLVQAVKTQSLEAQEHQWLPFEFIVDALGVERSLNRSPIFQAMFVMQNSAFDFKQLNSQSKQQLSIQAANFEVAEQYITSKFEVTLEISEGKTGFEANFEYDRKLFSKQTIELYAHYFSYLLNEMITKSNENVFSLPLENPQDTRKNSIRFNDNVRAYPRDLSLIDIFETSVKQHGKSCALQDDSRQISYEELNSLANIFGEKIFKSGIQAQDRVALYFDRSINFVIALLACHKAAAVYVPVNPDYPKERRDYILKDSSATALIYQSSAEPQAREDKLTFKNLKLIELEDKPKNTNGNISSEKPHRKNIHANECAAVLYTSGSTGEPKGVQLTHRGIARLVINSNYFSVNENDCFAMINNICFDASSFEIWGALLNGSKAVVFEPEVVLSPDKFKQYNQRYHASCMLVPTGLFHNTVAEDPSTFLGVKHLLIGGEAVDIQLAHQVLDHSQPDHFINVYGPTENATITTTWEIGGIKKAGQKVNIGAPIANTSVYIVDKHLNLLPTAVPGELVCAGDGLSLGYQNKNTPNQRNFIQHPFPDLEKIKTPDEKYLEAYRSGDFARFLPNGELEFLGRMDQQVKIRGYRVEPDEVAAVINGIDFIEHASVVALINKKSHTQALHLVAYFVVAKGFDSVEIEQKLKQKLVELLPAYLVPSLCVRLDEIPLTPNGKIDRRALPEPNWQAMSKAIYLAPETELQKQIAEIWQRLLGLEKVGLNENFFEIGGNSLSATRVIAQCSKASGRDIPLRTLFEAPVLKSFCETLEKSNYLGLSVIPVVDRHLTLPLSFGQQRLWFLEQLSEGDSAYHIPFALNIDGEINTNKLAEAFQLVIQRHEILRTRFAVGLENQSAQQVIEKNSGFALDVIDASRFSEAQLQTHITKNSAKVFDLGKANLLRAYLYEKKHSSILLLVMHHIIGDAWSLEILAKEIFYIYSGTAAKNLPQGLPALDIQYADYAYWQQQAEQQAQVSNSLNLWKDVLTNVPVLQLPFDKQRPLIESHHGDSVSIQIDSETYQRLKIFGEQQGVTLFMSLLAVFQVVLARYSGQNDFAIGTPVANRNHPQLENLIGFFANTLAIRSDIDNGIFNKSNDGKGEQSFIDLVKRVKERTLFAYSHQHVPFEQVVDVLKLERDLSHSPIFQVMLSLTTRSSNISTNANLQANQDFNISNFETKRKTAKFDLTLELTETELSELQNSVEGLFEFNKDIFERSTIEYLAKHFKHLLNNLLSHPEVALHTLPLLSAEEHSVQLVEWQSARVAYDSVHCLHERFEAQAQATPNALALVYGDQQYSYEELNQRANQLAHYLIEQGVHVGEVLGVCLPACPDLLISVLAILKAGGTYLPMDVLYPDERLHYFMEDSACTWVLTHSTQESRLLKTNTSCRLLSVDTQNLFAHHPQTNLGLSLSSDNLLYVIYTSGSTGLPNRTATTHAKEANLLQWYQSFGMGSHDRLLLLSAVGFDLTQKNLFAPLISGAAIVFPEQAHYDAESLVASIEQEKITWLNCAPSAFYPLVDLTANALTENNSTILNSLRYVFLGGEPISAAGIQPWYAHSTCQIVNSYGPTECTDVSHFHVLDKNHHAANIPIGLPIPNVTQYVFDEYLQLVPQGVVGELYLGGDGVGPGYLNNEVLNQSRFIENPYIKGERLYKTGDLVKVRKNGAKHNVLDYLGRRDFQVKIRGVRIELGEIEQAILNEPSIKACTVIVRNAKDDGRMGDDYLCAYIVTDLNNSEHDIKQTLKAALKQKLPVFMQPHYFEVLNELPLTPNGKVDRKRLPIPAQIEKVFVAPSTETEMALAQIWQEVLGVEQIGIHDNFFELGGHSLLATRVLSKLKTALKKQISLVHLFEYPELAELAKFIDDSAVGGGLDLIPLADRSQTLLLSYSQQRIWFLEQLNPGSSFFHMPSVLKISGKLDGVRFESCVQLVVKRHESLRTNFQIMNNEEQPQQIIHTNINWQLNRITLHHENDERIKNKIAELLQIPFDLSSDSLLRMHLLELDKQQYYLLSVMHHIISDGWSIEILLKEIMTAYLLDESSLDKLEIQYADFAQWQRTQLSNLLNEQENYWCTQLRDVPSLQLPFDHTRPVMESHRGATLSFNLNKNESEKLKVFSEKYGVTLFMTVMAAFQVLLNRYSGQNDFAVGTPIANRNHPQLENLIGCFINTLAIRANLEQQKTFRELVSDVKRSSLEAFNRQELPFEKIVDALSRTENLERNLSQSPIFQVMLLVNNKAVGSSIFNDIESGEIDAGNLQISNIEAENHTAKFDLTLELSETSISEIEGFSGHLEYNTDLFEESTAKQFIQHFKNLLNNLLSQSEVALHTLPLLSAEEQSVQLVEWQSARVDYDKAHCLHERFEQQVQATPHALALVHGDQKYSYAELNQRANQLAHYLIEQGVQVGDVLGVCLPACPDLLMSVLAIVKAGGTYLPMDVQYPDERLQYFMEDSGCTWVLTHSSQAARLSKQHGKTNEKTNSKNICRLLSVDDQNLFAHCPQTNLDLSLSSDNLLYVIYTSGSTGLPNRTATTHAKEANLLQWYHSFGMGSADRLLLLSAVGFDLTQKNLFAPLLSGAAIVFPEQAHYDAESLVASIEKEKVTWLNCAPSAFYPLIALTENTSHATLNSLRYVFLGGEPISAAGIQPWYRESSCQIVNSYGPTECTDVSHFHVLDKNHHAANIPIGLPIPNVTQYVFDEHLQLVPQGVVGELYLGGDGVGPGYLNNEVLNQSRFIENPYIKGERLYKTGDLVKVRKNGAKHNVLDYLGRRDFQVKIRGVRIELGEIEQAILTEPSIKACTVIVRNAKDDGRMGDDYLCAYVVIDSSENEQAIKQLLKSALKQKLPVFMQPHYFEVLSELPLTPNGKVDRKRLPIPTQIEKIFVAPSTETEKALAQIWQEVLDVEQIGIHDNFFELGGHSLLATRVVAKVRNSFNVELELRIIFELDNLEEMAALVSTLQHFKNETSDDDLEEIDL